MHSIAMRLLSDFDDAIIFEEAAKRLKERIESAIGSKLTFGEAVFIYHNGALSRVECKPSVRVFLKQGEIETYW